MKILVLEDHDTDAAIMERVLKRSGISFEWTVVASEDAFCEAVTSANFDIVLADYSLPSFNATAALQYLKQNNINLPMILVSGTISEDFAISIIRNGAYDYILKDRLQRLPSAITAAMEKCAMETEQRKYIEQLAKYVAMMKRSEQLAHIGSWESDIEHDTVLWSDENYRILGYEPGEITPSLNRFLERIHPDDAQEVKDTIHEAITNAQDVKFRCRVILPGGDIHHLENNLFITKNTDHKTVSISGFSTDITARGAHREEVHKTGSMK